MAEVNEQLGREYRWRRVLSGGEQTGAHLVTWGDQCAVLKWEPAGWRADQLLQAFPAVTYALERGWPAARWLAVGPLAGGGSFVLQEYVDDVSMSVIDTHAAQAVTSANAAQAGAGLASARDDSAQLEDVLSGGHPWTRQVSAFTRAGAALVRHGQRIAAKVGAAPLPRLDVVHGDYSSSNILLGSADRPVTFIDCQTIGRGTRVRDLADLYRQSFVYPDPANTGARQLRSAALEAEGPQVFAKCAVAVTLNNLAWWAGNKTAAEFDRACSALHDLFDDIQEA
ncbi:aminoglycoside phosphotransferase family protein [Desertihabitans aurantiacus]|uniref:aminoglycoside phosphotransferase family protein n=1 Tax=Desertihabitans aurantiacus TaxID=2282477 RepID=UPI001300435B|nr:aminoglycoside phosphotransferase family protein [Desertihabitans aurantiacus]